MSGVAEVPLPSAVWPSKPGGHHPTRPLSYTGSRDGTAKRQLELPISPIYACGESPELFWQPPPNDGNQGGGSFLAPMGTEQFRYKPPFAKKFLTTKH